MTGYRVGLIVLCIAGAACRDSTAPLTVSGQWAGSAIVAEQAFEMTADLSDAGGTVTGTGTITSAGINCDPAIAGTRSGSSVSLTFTCTAYMPFSFVATLSKDGRTLVGRLNGSGFQENSLSLSKER